MKRNLLYCLFLVAAATGSARAADQSDFQLKNGDRVVFYGDSITDQRLYTTFAETYVVTRFPKLDVTFVHSGWGGDRVTGGGGGPIDVRLKRDVFAYKPTVMSIMLGMNDGSYRAFDQKIFDTYANGFQHIIDELKKNLPGLRLTLIEPSPYDDVTRPPTFGDGYNAVLVKYSEFVKELAQREHQGVADLNTPVVEALRKAYADDQKLAQKILPDRVHPGPAGHLLMAEALLKSWNAPTVVTAVEIDAAAKTATRAEGTKVSQISASVSGLSWVQDDAALPMAVDTADATMSLALKSSDFVEAMDQEPLKVTGLAAERYSLKIDGSEVGSFTKEQLAAGVNLALLATPMLKQAMEVHKLTLQHNNIHFQRWRQIQVPYANDANEKVKHGAAELMSGLDENEAGVVEQQRAKAQPVEHKYELNAL